MTAGPPGQPDGPAPPLDHTTMTALTKIDPATVSMFSNIAQSLALAGFFPIGGQYQAKSREEQAAQAFVKILAGHELGIGPVLAMQHIHIIDGKTSLDATMVAGLIKSSGKYDYRVEALTDKGCALTFWELREGAWMQIGSVTWGEADARRAGLLNKRGDMYSKYPRDLYFSRAITFGARRFCPDVFLGPIYTPDELGEDVPPSSVEGPVPAPVLPAGDGAQQPAQLAEHVEGPDYETLMGKIATRLQKTANASDAEWEKQEQGARDFVATWPDDLRIEALTIIDGILEARNRAKKEAAMSDSEYITAEDGYDESGSVQAIEDDLEYNSN